MYGARTKTAVQELPSAQPMRERAASFMLLLSNGRPRVMKSRKPEMVMRPARRHEDSQTEIETGKT